MINEWRFQHHEDLIRAVCNAALRRRAGNYSPDLDVLDDAMQDARIRLLEQASYFDSSTMSEREFVVREARRAAGSVLRKSHPRREWRPTTEAGDFFYENRPSGDLDVLTILSSDVDREELRALANRLPGQLRDVTTRFLDGDGVAEVAARLSLGQAAVRRLLEAASGIIRAALGLRVPLIADYAIGQIDARMVELVRDALMEDPRAPASRIRVRADRLLGVRLEEALIRRRYLRPLRNSMGINRSLEVV